MFPPNPIKKQKTTSPDTIGGIVVSLNGKNRNISFLIELVKKIRPDRPGNFQQAETNFRALLFSLQNDRSLLFSLRRALLTHFLNTNIILALTESGVSRSRGFVQELSSKLQHKILPPLQKKTDFLFVINRVFFKKTDHIWVEGIDPTLWKSFFEILGIQINLAEVKLTNQLQQALQILSYRLANIGLEKEIVQYLDPVGLKDYPFLEQSRLVNLYVEMFQAALSEQEKRVLLTTITEALYNCRQQLLLLKSQRATAGTSLGQTYLMIQMEQCMERMFVIIDVLDNDQVFNTERFIQYFSNVIHFENLKNSLREFLNVNLALLAYQIAEHKGRKGESFITTTRKQYVALFNSAMAGGFIISFIAIFKNLIYKLPLPLFWQGIVYGTNYSFGFVLMDQAGGTLATKQPAYTASAVAGSLDAKKYGAKPDLSVLASTFAKIARSQIASFAGNLIIVFPITFLLAKAWEWITGHTISNEERALSLLQDQHPFQSLALFYACITGFFLFLSGIIAGYVENSVLHNKFLERIISHPVLSYSLSEKRINKLAHMIRNNTGTLAGSISLGFFLGFAGPLGKILGLPIDIRHITISAGNVAIGLNDLQRTLPTSYIITVILGVLLIGTINFLVSFSLAFIVALKSRGIKLKAYPELIGILWQYFKQHPSLFFFPPANKLP
jgi:site-specific recombinase